MAKQAIKKAFSGIIPPMVTPLLSDNLSLDLDGVKHLVEHLVLGGVHGIFILGTTGESTSLSYSTREKLILETCKAVNGRVPVLVGITDTSIEESIRLAAIAKKSGAAAVVAAPPYYFGLGQEELFKYYWSLADQVNLPLFLYNMPSHTKINIDVKTVVRLAEHPNIIGLKDSSANAVYFQSLCYLLKTNFTLLVGPEEITAQTVMMGGHGGVNGGANLFPKLYVALYNAAIARDFSRIEELQNLVMEISTRIYTVGSYGSSYLKGLKGALSALGIVRGNIAQPFTSFDEKEMNKVIDIIKEIEIKVAEVL
ncbi:dihydrodipicolinate synthase family protein [Flavobacterium gilvum]|uniref:Dihydrodipicolinate synthase family protein n=1 Tax=Flavobacterium gilvum TaxID=1492737 RepID=A0AAC9I278_9FLAO|nr:dihydrodipicolinate synthase family protein [Flavobacterium gilvum]AOW08106.1 dihydrodipicolinate synthase family protein [Flavobacterium gilvum]KFC58873.1 4-hydroxy-tetrahydrodipicolinate synthase [Flavobacterium gilvum]